MVDASDSVLRMNHPENTSATAAAEAEAVAKIDAETRIALVRTTSATQRCVGTVVMERSESAGIWSLDGAKGNPGQCYPIEPIPRVELDTFNRSVNGNAWLAIVGVVNDPSITIVNWKIYDRNKRGQGADAYRTIPISVTNGAFDGVVRSKGLTLEHVTVWGTQADGSTVAKHRIP